LYHDNEYLGLIRQVLESGSKKTDRTGTGTISRFGLQMRFDLSDGHIPLLTTKKMHTKSIIRELLWFLRGDTNNTYLDDHGVRIWREWSSPEGHLNKIYGAQWRRWEKKNWMSKSNGVYVKVRSEEGLDLPFDAPNDTPEYEKTIFGEGCIGTYKESHDYFTKAYLMWHDMMARCYDAEHPKYPTHGGIGVFVDQQWRCFSVFLRDIHNIPLFSSWTEDPKEYELDKEYYRGNCYSPRTCMFLPKQYAETLHTPTIGETEPVTMVFRQKIVVDQIANVIDTLRTNPDDRRIIVSAWNVGELEDAALPPCHAFFQFYSRIMSRQERIHIANTVDDDVGIDTSHEVLDIQGIPRRALSCQLYQRSADVGLGVPFNIAQYSILVNMIAQCTNHVADEFIWSGGDVHIYLDHIGQLTEQLERNPMESPKLVLRKGVNEIDDFEFDDFSIEDYNHHPTIQMKVSI